ncbi:hypothetical protein [Metapseudomonas resinovorans]|uniref:Uncharacterized protein n=1 Tax=Metapseudomonas resinovorans NBRC 106553 TaxID=1245471 RepID=S6AFE5_METRE|nr:hypothetical protein [Pseudomonas resinovorans]BAN46475.1 hypothetical protein PCA10_07430 [Pseudomonas resinovorans NBRC 106553]
MNMYLPKRSQTAHRADLLMNGSAAIVLTAFLLFSGPHDPWLEGCVLAMIGLAAWVPIKAMLRHYTPWPQQSGVRASIPTLLTNSALLGAFLLMPVALALAPWSAAAFGIGLLCSFLLDRSRDQRADR